jgi:hypothetical protein
VTIRWRLAVFTLQLLLIGGLTYIVYGSPYSQANWYGSLVALAINTQLLEPHFPRPVDVLANSIVGLIFYFVASKTLAEPGWHALAVALIAAIALSAGALILGANRSEGRLITVARASRVLSGVYTSAFIYSAIFWLGLLDTTGGVSGPFWPTGLAWALVLAVGAVNWQAVWATARGRPVPAEAEGLIGPSKLLVAGPSMPRQGTSVIVSGAGQSTTGTVLTRIRRSGDVWAAIHLDQASASEGLLAAKTLTIESNPTTDSSVLGIVDAASTNTVLVFAPTRPLRIGDVVAVSSEAGPVLYQLTKAEVVDVHVKGGGNLAVQARAVQLGVLQSSSARLVRHRWVPEPGAPVLLPPTLSVGPTQDRLLLGHLIGTGIPVYLEGDMLCEGHLAILGMTRMGKTTLATRLAKFLGVNNAVIVMDQTGEYRTKQGLPLYNPLQHDSAAGLSVFEPAAGKPVPDEGLQQLKELANKGYTEYKGGTPFKRVLLIDEAHQFVPEPALLGFGAPGRDSAITFGMYAMQIRKYGITLVMVSQRTAVVAKTALSQCENVIAFKSVDQTGLDYLEAVLGAQARDILPNLQAGEALVCGPAISSDYPVAIKVAISLPQPAGATEPQTGAETDPAQVSDGEADAADGAASVI